MSEFIALQAVRRTWAVTARNIKIEVLGPGILSHSGTFAVGGHTFPADAQGAR